MSSSKRLKRGEEAFHGYYSSLFNERWPSLVEACGKPSRYHTLREGLLFPYHMDAASYAAAASLGVQPGEEVLDMCAAPGGKTLVLAMMMEGQGTLTANERSSRRRARLKEVLEKHLPKPLQDIITVTPHDARKWGLYEKNRYHRVLLDVPCSSERHLINSPRYLSNWSEARTKQLSRQAYAFLAAAASACLPGGVVLYSTCALSPLENDGVIDTLLEKGRHPLVPKELSPVFDSGEIHLKGEATKHGVQFLPDYCNGAGPLYMASLLKLGHIINPLETA